MNVNRRGDRTLAAVALVVLLAACGGGDSAKTATERPGPSAQDVAVGVEPAEAAVQTGGGVAFAALVTGTANTAVAWDVMEQGGGTVTAGGAYTAPGTAGTYRVRVTSAADPTKSAFATVTVTVTPPVTVAISPRTPTVAAAGSVSFTATVANAGGGVTWSVLDAGCGTITSAGVYTAPGAAASCRVRAASASTPSATDTVTVAVSAPPPVVAVTVSPSSGAVNACQTLTLVATVTGSTDKAVTWSVQEGAAGGSITSGGVYTAASSAGSYHAVATSHADPSKKAVVPITVTEKVLGVAVSPQNISVPAGGTAQFTATVTTTCGTFESVQTLTASAQ